MLFVFACCERPGVDCGTVDEIKGVQSGNSKRHGASRYTALAQGPFTLSRLLQATCRGQSDLSLSL